MEALTVDGLREAVRRGATMVDVRPWELVARDPLVDAVHAPLEQLARGRMPDLPLDTDLVVVCEWGRKSELAGLYLEANGFTRVRHLLGGVAEVRRSGVVTDAKPGTEPR